MNGLLRSLLIICILTTLITGCSAPELPSLPDLPVELPDLSDLPGVPDVLRDLPGLLQDLGLPDLSGIANLPSLEDLPGLQTPSGSIAYNGPTERRVNPGQRIPGTDIVLSAVRDGKAEFQIAGLRSERSQGDSLDFDGEWPGVAGSTYTARLRIYHIAADHVRVAGVHRLLLTNIQPSADGSQPAGFTLKFPFTVNVAAGETIAGTTYGYVGMDERGGQLSGLPANDYPYRKGGDSISWTGHIRPDISAAYNIRMLYYSAEQAQVGGVVTLGLPGE